MDIAPECRTEYRLATGGLTWRTWDDDVVVYNPTSGDTHRIARPAGAMLFTLERNAPLDMLKLKSFIHRDVEMSVCTDILDLFVELGLVKEI